MRAPNLSTRLTLIALAALYLLLILVQIPLLRVEYLQHMGSIEAAYIAMADWMSRHPDHLLWYPLWYSGMPLQNAYQNGLPALTSLLQQLTSLSAAHAYHITCALLFALGPVGLALLIWRASRDAWWGLASGFTWAFFSASAFLIREVRHDMAGPWFPRRFHALVIYGEGPNVAGLSLVPWAWWALHEAVESRRPTWVALAALLMGATLMISIPAALVMLAGIALYILSRPHKHWLSSTLFATLSFASAYLLISPWFLPSTVADNQRNSQMIGGDYRYRIQQYVAIAALAVAAIALRFLLERWKFGPTARWMTLLAIPFSWVALAAFWFRFATIPQPERFHLAMEIPISVLLAGALLLLARRYLTTPRAQLVMRIAILILVLAAGVNFYRFAHKHTRPQAIHQTVEYQVAQWLKQNHPDSRVYATDSTSFWMNVWNDSPQLKGCCLPGLPNRMDWIHGYFVPSADGGQDRYLEMATLWLKALGSELVVVGGPQTRAYYKDWRRADVLRQAFPTLWQRGDDAILQVPLRSTELAHVVPASAIPARAPENGIDIQPLQAYVAALDQEPPEAATFRWLHPERAEITADLRQDDVVSLQVTAHPGWRATNETGRSLAVERDGIGHIVLRPGAGSHTIRLEFDGGDALSKAYYARASAAAALVLWIVFDTVRRRKHTSAA